MTIPVDEFFEGFNATITLSPLSPHWASEGINGLADHLDMVAAIIGLTGIFPPLRGRRYNLIFEALLDNDLPLVLHDATGLFIRAHPLIKCRLKSYYEVRIVSRSFSQMGQLSSTSGGGSPE